MAIGITTVSHASPAVASATNNQPAAKSQTPNTKSQSSPSATTDTGVPATGRKIRFDVHARGRFVDGKMAERWDRADFEDIKRQLTAPTQ